MDGHRFDFLTRSLTEAKSRRNTLKALAAGIAAGTLGQLGLESGAAAKCVQLGKSCRRPKGKPRPKCCGKTKCKGNKCRCPKSLKACGKGCIRKNQCCTNRDCLAGQACAKNHACVESTCTANRQCRGAACVCTPTDNQVPNAGECQANSFSQNFSNNANGWFAVLAGDNDDPESWEAPETNNTMTVIGGEGQLDTVGNRRIDRSAATNWGGYSTLFPNGGFSTSIDIYLDPGAVPSDPMVPGIKFAYAVALTDASNDCAKATEFFVHGGGGGPEVNYCVRLDGGLAANPCLGVNSRVITEADFYTFVQEFREVAGQLRVTRRLLRGATEVFSTSENQGPIANFGGNRYGWFPIQDFGSLRITNSRRTNG